MAGIHLEEELEEGEEEEGELEGCLVLFFMFFFSVSFFDKSIFFRGLPAGQPADWANSSGGIQGLLARVPDTPSEERKTRSAFEYSPRNRRSVTETSPAPSQLSTR